MSRGEQQQRTTTVIQITLGARLSVIKKKLIHPTKLVEISGIFTNNLHVEISV